MLQEIEGKVFMNKEDLLNLKKKISELSEEEKKNRDLYLKQISDGTLEGPMTGYASIDKPWLKYFDEYAINAEIKNIKAYEYFLENAPDKYPLIEYYGNIFYKKDIVRIVELYKKRFKETGIREGDTVSVMMLDVPESIFVFMALNDLKAITNFIKFDEVPERIKFMNKLGESEMMIISDVPFIKDHVIDAVQNEDSIKRVVSVPITNCMSLHAQLNLLLENNKNTGNVKGIIEQLKNIKNDKKETKLNCSKLIDINEFLKKKQDCVLDEKAKNNDEDIAIIVYSGGTTGDPKGIQLTNRNLNTMSHDFKYGGYGFSPGKNSLNILPPGPSYYLNATIAQMCSGVNVNMIYNFNIKDYPRLIKENKPNIFLSGPILLKELAEQDIIDDTSFIIEPISGGDKLHVEEEKKINEYLKRTGANTFVHQGYGESECTAAATYCKNESYLLGSIGIPMPKVEVGIFEFSDDKEEYSVEKKFGEIGEICISGPTLMYGYKGNEKATNEVLKMHSDGKLWLHTEDLGYMLNDGNLFHCGRAKRMLTRSGAKIWLGALEDTIKKIPEIKDCCCVKMDSNDEREVPVAHIVLNDESIDYNELITHIKNVILTHQNESYIPKYFVIRNQIPITEVNKKVDFKSLEKEPIVGETGFINEEILVKTKKR